MDFGYQVRREMATLKLEDPAKYATVIANVKVPCSALLHSVISSDARDTEYHSLKMRSHHFCRCCGKDALRCKEVRVSDAINPIGQAHRRLREPREEAPQFDAPGRSACAGLQKVVPATPPPKLK